MPAQVRVFAPGSIGNLGPGLDILGLAVAGTGDVVTATRTARAGVSISEPGHPSLPADPARHTSGIAAAAVLREAGAKFGLELRIEKGLPLSGGQGGSAASAVAGAVAANLLLDRPLPRDSLLLAALEAEATVSGRHADNIVAILMGGLVLIRSMDPLDLISLPVPAGLWLVMAQPDREMNTRDARSLLPVSVPREDALHQAAQVAAIVAAAYSGDLELLGRAIDDRIAEPVRGPRLAGFVAAKRAALAAGALGCSISGSGPSAFALVRDEDSGHRVARAMEEAYGAEGVACRTRLALPDREGARAL
ncbi:MAG TPA: homoserine kinase [Gemmatimonadales bacterium]